MLTAHYLYAGYSDYFGGYGCADNAEHSEHLLYACYGRHTTLHDIVDQLVEDSYSACDSDRLPADYSDGDVREAILAGLLNDTGREDYESGALAECSANMERLTECPDCEAELDGDEDYDQCPECNEWFDQDESPVFIVVLDYEKPAESSDCLEYDSQTGCGECEGYDDCGDREDNLDHDAE